MSLDMNDPMDRLYLECLPRRISRPDPGYMADGPTARFMAAQLANEVGDDGWDMTVDAA